MDDNILVFVLSIVYLVIYKLASDSLMALVAISKVYSNSKAFVKSNYRNIVLLTYRQRYGKTKHFRTLALNVILIFSSL